MFRKMFMLLAITLQGCEHTNPVSPEWSDDDPNTEFEFRTGLEASDMIIDCNGLKVGPVNAFQKWLPRIEIQLQQDGLSEVAARFDFREIAFVGLTDSPRKAKEVVYIISQPKIDDIGSVIEDGGIRVHMDACSGQIWSTKYIVF